MVARSVDDRIKDVDARIADMESAHKEDMAKMEEKYARRMAALQAKKASLDARKRGDTAMGNKDERLAFLRVLEAKGGFGFSYAQALAVLKQVSEGSNMDNAERLAALGDEGRALMQPRMPKRGRAAPDARQASAVEGPGGDDAGAGEGRPTTMAQERESDAHASDASGNEEESSRVLSAAGDANEIDGEAVPAGDGDGWGWDDGSLPESSGDPATEDDLAPVEHEEWA